MSKKITFEQLVEKSFLNEKDKESISLRGDSSANQYNSLHPSPQNYKLNSDQIDKFFKISSDWEEDNAKAPKILPFPLDRITLQLVKIFEEINTALDILTNSLNSNMLSNLEKETLKIEITHLKNMKNNIINFSKKVEKMSL